MSRGLGEWAYQRGVQLDVTHPSSPSDNGHIKSSNGRVQHDCLNLQQLVSLADAREKIEVWRWDHNHV